MNKLRVFVAISLPLVALLLAAGVEGAGQLPGAVTPTMSDGDRKSAPSAADGEGGQPTEHQAPTLLPLPDPSLDGYPVAPESSPYEPPTGFLGAFEVRRDTLLSWDLRDTTQLGQLTVISAISDGGGRGTQVGSGDVNGDGRVDVIMSGPEVHALGRVDCGAAYVYYGPLGLSGTLRFAHADVAIYGPSTDAVLWGLAVGDVNGDDVDDVILGASGDDEVYVVFGSPALPAMIDLDAEYDCRMSGVSGDRTGSSVSLGDIDGDGIQDVLIAAPLNDYRGSARSNCGAYFVAPGRAVWPSDIQLMDETVILGAEGGDGVSSSAHYPGMQIVSGDINGDGYGDVLIGAPGADGLNNAHSQCGEAYAIFGREALPDTIDLATSADLICYGIDSGDHIVRLGSGDVDGDGIDDLMIGARDAHGPYNVRPDAGEVYVVYGREVLPAVLELETNADVTIYGADTGDILGRMVAHDVNGDGVADLLLGAPNADGPGNSRNDCGEAYLLFGYDLPREIDLKTYPHHKIYGSDSGDGLSGYGSLAFGGVDEDDVADLIIGAYDADGMGNSYSGTGEAYVVSGWELAYRELDVAVTRILAPPSEVDLGTTSAPAAEIRNLGLHTETFPVVFRIGSAYAETLSVTLESGAVDTVWFTDWTASEPASFPMGCVAALPGDENGTNDMKSGRVFIVPEAGPVVWEISPDHGCNDYGLLTVQIAGMRFEEGLTAVLEQDEGPDIVGDEVTAASSVLAQASFDLTDATEGLRHLRVTDPWGSSYVFYEGFEITEFDGQMMPFGPWNYFLVAQGTTVEVGVSVPPGIDDLFVLIKKTTHIGYSGTWSGSMTVLREGVEIGSTSGNGDFEFHFRQPEGGWYTLMITSYDPGEGYVKVSDTVDALTLGEWDIGEVLRPYGSDWKQLDVPSGQASLFLETEGFGLWSTLDVYRGLLGNPDAHWYFGQGYHIEGEIEDPPAGTYYLRYMDSAVMQGAGGQTREYMIIADTEFLPPPPPPEPVITDLSTYVGGTAGPVTVIVYGAGLSPEATVSLQRDGYDDIEADHVGGDSTMLSLEARFDLAATAPGEWALTVINPDEQTATAPSPFLVADGGEPELWVEIVGRDQIRIGRTQTYVLRYGNSGDLDATHCYVALGVPWVLDYEVDVPWSMPPPEMDPDPPEESIQITLLEVSRLHPQSSRDVAFTVTASQYADDVFLSADITLDPSPYFQSLISCIPPEPPMRRTEPWVLRDDGDSCPAGAIVFWHEFPGYENPEADWIHVGKCVGGGQFTHFFEHGIQTLPIDEYDDADAHGFLGHHSPSWEDGDRVTELAEYAEENWPGGPPSDPGTKSKYTNELCAMSVSDDLYETNCIGYVWFLNATFRQNNVWGVGEMFDEVMEDLDEFDPLPDGDKRERWDDLVTGDYRSSGGTAKEEELCPEGYDEQTEYDRFKKEVELVLSSTPEDKFGVAGYDPPGTAPDGLQRFVVGGRGLSYRVDFWNKEDATAPAQDVFVVDTLDVAFADSTLAFTEFGFLRWTIPLEGGQYFNIDVDMRPDEGLIVDVEGKYDSDTREVSWTFRSLDPATGETPEMEGFLPPITESGYEIGWVDFTVEPVSDLPSGTVIANQAFVNFDGQPAEPGGPYWSPAPKEGPYVNTIDSEPPTSFVLALPDTQTRSTFTVEIVGEDDEPGSGVAYYSIYVSDNGDEYTKWRDITEDSVEFSGVGRHTYCFYSTAVDNVGNREAAPDVPDACATVRLTERTIVGPNPFVPSRGHTSITFTGERVPGSTIKIFNKAGELVQTLRPGSDETHYEWGGKSRDGKDLASGVYVWVLSQSSGYERSGKFAIIR